MALDAIEWFSILAILAVIFLWGPQKIPELARMVARARREFEAASRELQKVGTEFQNSVNPLDTSKAETPRAAQQNQAAVVGAGGGSSSSSPSSNEKSADELLVQSARELGIATLGKRREQISAEILAIAKANSPAAREPPLTEPAQVSQNKTPSASSSPEQKT